MLGHPRVWPVLLAVEGAVMGELRIDGRQLSRVVAAAGGLPVVCGPEPTSTGFDPLPAECIDEEDSLLPQRRGHETHRRGRIAAVRLATRDDRTLRYSAATPRR